MAKCISPIEQEHQDKMRYLKDKWNSNSFVNKAYGDASSENFEKMFTNMFIQAGATGYGAGIIPSRNGKLDYTVYNQVSKAIDNMESVLKNGINPIKQQFLMTSQSLDMHPLTHKFNKEVDDMLNYERKYRKMTNNTMSSIKDNLISLSLMDKTGMSFNKAIKTLEDLNNAIRVKSLEGKDASKEIIALKNFVDGDGTAKMVKAYAVIMDKFTVNGISKLLQEAKLNGKNTVTLEGTEYKTSLIQGMIPTIETSKAFMGEMGKVNINGLEKMKVLIDSFYKNAFLSKNNVMSSQIKSIKKDIDDAIDRLKKGIQSGNYYPHQTLTGLVSLEETFSKFDFNKITKEPSSAMDFMNSIKQNMRSFTSNVLSRNQSVTLYDLNAIKALESYSLNAVQFNKSMNMFDSFIKLATDINPNNFKDPSMDKSIDSVLDFISVKLHASLYGYSKANNAVKNVVSVFTKLQTASKMGLSFLGAVRNATQFGYYVIQNGLMKSVKASGLYKSNRSYNFNGKDMTMSGILGMKDNGIDSEIYFDAIETVSSGSLFSTEGVPKSSIRIDFDKNNDIVVSYEQDGVIKKFDRGLAEVTGKSLVFHQWSENMLRGKVYKDSFALNFNSLYEQGYVESYMRNNPKSSKYQAEIAMLKDAKNAALNIVKLTQFDYNNFEKPQAFGGGVDNKSVIGSAVFQFMTFPAGMIKYNNKILGEAFQDIKNGNIDTIRVGAASRLIGAQVMVGLASLLFNNDFSFMFSNDTYERANKLYKFLTEDPENRKDVNYQQGLLSLVSGPLMSDTIFLLQSLGIEHSNDELSELIFGYQRMSEMSDDLKERKMLSSISVSLARLHRDYQSVEDGNMKQLIANNIGIRTNRDLSNRSKYFKESIGMTSNSEDTFAINSAKLRYMTTDQLNAFKIIKERAEKNKKKQMKKEYEMRQMPNIRG
ncbi:hypothetical protein GW932_02730 [archaeon]|nr:hypothetical protein [archaeon]